jgi:hypothetical protein
MHPAPRRGARILLFCSHPRVYGVDRMLAESSLLALRALVAVKAVEAHRSAAVAQRALPTTRIRAEPELALREFGACGWPREPLALVGSTSADRTGVEIPAGTVGRPMINENQFVVLGRKVGTGSAA